MDLHMLHGKLKAKYKNRKIAELYLVIEKVYLGWCLPQQFGIPKEFTLLMFSIYLIPQEGFYQLSWSLTSLLFLMCEVF